MENLFQPSRHISYNDITMITALFLLFRFVEIYQTFRKSVLIILQWLKPINKVFLYLQVPFVKMHINGNLGKGASGECTRLTDKYSREAAVKRVSVLICKMK